jgi:hypothetical protein
VTASQIEQSLATGFGGVATGAYRIKKSLISARASSDFRRVFLPGKKASTVPLLLLSPAAAFSGLCLNLIYPKHRTPDHT